MREDRERRTEKGKRGDGGREDRVWRRRGGGLSYNAVLDLLILSRASI